MNTANKSKIMIVEDDEIHMDLMKDILRPAGYVTVGTKFGKQAVRLARKHRPDLIIMDIKLGDISGLEVTRRLKQDDQLERIPVIVVTAFAMKGDKEMCFAAGCNAYIAKPIQVSQFLYMVQRLLETYGAKNAKNDPDC